MSKSGIMWHYPPQNTPNTVGLRSKKRKWKHDWIIIMTEARVTMGVVVMLQLSERTRWNKHTIPDKALCIKHDLIIHYNVTTWNLLIWLQEPLLSELPSILWMVVMEQGYKLQYWWIINHVFLLSSISSDDPRSLKRMSR